MSDNENEITLAEVDAKPKRKYVQSGRPRDNLWKRICEQHGIKNYRKGTPDSQYDRARELYIEALKVKKNLTVKSIMTNTTMPSMPVIEKEVIYQDEPEAFKNEDQKPTIPIKQNEEKIKKNESEVPTSQVSKKGRPAKHLRIETAHTK
jgi:hypothetical protein